jgi:hypothetical protein
MIQSPTFSLPLTGQEQIAYGRMVLAVQDARAVKERWHLQLGLLPITNEQRGHTLTDAVLSLSDVQVVCENSPCVTQSVEPRWGAHIPQSAGADATVQILSMPPDGHSAMTITIGLALRVPAHAYSGEYLIRPVVAVAEEN